MKNKFIPLIIILLTSCNYAISQKWVKKANFPGSTRGNACGFSINNIGYVGNGSSGNTYPYDYYAYEPVSDSWQRIKDLSLASSVYVCPYKGFAIKGKGFVEVAGGNYEYDPALDSWTQHYPDGIQNYAFIATANDTAYLLSSGQKSMQKYDLLTHRWNDVYANYPGHAEFYSVPVSLNGKVYFGTGDSASYEFNDFWKFDPSTKTWTQMANVPGPARSHACSFTINNKGYVGLGTSSNSASLKDFYEYDPITNKWKKIPDYPGAGSEGVTGLTINERGFAGLGWIDNDWWEYIADTAVATGTSQIKIPASTFEIYPNPAMENITINAPQIRIKEFVDIVIMSVTGQVMMTEKMIMQNDLSVNIKSIPPGIYYLQIASEGNKCVRKFVKQ